MRKTGLNSSLREQLEVDKVTLVDGTGVNAETPKEVATTINTEDYYNPATEVLPRDGNPLFYEVAVRSSGLEVRTTLHAIKGSYVLGKIGGILVFMFFVVSLLAKPYSQLVQQVELARLIYKSKDSHTLS